MACWTLYLMGETGVSGKNMSGDACLIIRCAKRGIGTDSIAAAAAAAAHWSQMDEKDHLLIFTHTLSGQR